MLSIHVLFPSSPVANPIRLLFCFLGKQREKEFSNWLGSQSPTEGFLKRRHSSRGFAYIIHIPSVEKNYMKMLNKAEWHRNISYNVATSISVRRKVARFIGLEDPFEGCSQVSPMTLVHGGLRSKWHHHAAPCGLTFIVYGAWSFPRTILTGQLPGRLALVTLFIRHPPQNKQKLPEASDCA